MFFSHEPCSKQSFTKKQKFEVLRNSSE